LRSYTLIVVEVKAMAFSLVSTAFSPGSRIPSTHSIEGRDSSPPLSWSGQPGGVGSYALICDDPDAPAGTWVHWVIFNIPASSNGLREGVSKVMTLEDGTRQGKNDFGRIGYGGPAPPPGKPHGYVFTLSALNGPLAIGAGCTKAQLLAAMKGHVLSTASLQGSFQR
jgi:Raf kinase inhibitor-like YbhB/YbcL family protein